MIAKSNQQAAPQPDEQKHIDLQINGNYRVQNQEISQLKNLNSHSGGLQTSGSPAQPGSHETLRSENGIKGQIDTDNIGDQALTDGKQVNTTNIDQKVERNINHFYNCKFVIKSREGSKTTLKDVGGTVNSDSRSRSKDGQNDEDDIEVQECAETPGSPSGIDDQRVQKLIEKIGSYASFKLTNQKPQEAQVAGDQAFKMDSQLRGEEDPNGLTKLNLAVATSQEQQMQNQARTGFLANPSLTPQSGRGAGQLQHLANMLSNNRKKEEVPANGQGPVTPSNANSALNAPQSGLLRAPSTLESRKANQWANRDSIFDFFQNPDLYIMNQAPSLSSQCQGATIGDKRAIQNQGLSQQQQKSSMLLRLLGAQSQQPHNQRAAAGTGEGRNLAYSSALKQASCTQALKLLTQPRSNNGRGASRNASPIKPTEKKHGEFFSKLQKIALSARISKEQELTAFDKSPRNANQPVTPKVNKPQPTKQFFSLGPIQSQSLRLTNNLENEQSPKASMSKMSNREALQAILPLLTQRQMSSKSRSHSKREDVNAPVEPLNSMPAFERQNMSIVSNLALANLNQDIEDIVPQATQKESVPKQQCHQDQIQQMQDALENKNLAQALMNQLSRGKLTSINSPAVSQGENIGGQVQNVMSYSEMRMKCINKPSQFSSSLHQHISAGNEAIDKKDKK